MLSTVFLIAAELMLLHVLLFFEMPAGKWKKIDYCAQVIPTPAPWKKTFMVITALTHKIFMVARWGPCSCLWDFHCP